MSEQFKVYKNLQNKTKKKKRRIITAPKKKVSDNLVDNLLIRPTPDKGGNKAH